MTFYVCLYKACFNLGKNRVQLPEFTIGKLMSLE